MVVVERAGVAAGGRKRSAGNGILRVEEKTGRRRWVVDGVVVIGRVVQADVIVAAQRAADVGKRSGPQRVTRTPSESDGKLNNRFVDIV